MSRANASPRTHRMLRARVGMLITAAGEKDLDAVVTCSTLSNTIPLRDQLPTCSHLTCSHLGRCEV